MNHSKPLGGRWLRLLAFAVLAGLVVQPAASATPRAQGSTFELHNKVPVARSDFPAPNDANIVFYIQRSMNSNTVVYTVNLRADGTIDPKQPVKAFWRRFNTDGEVKALGFFEKQMAYGVQARKGKTAGEYLVSFVALPGRTATLKQGADGAIELTFPMGKYKAKPVYAYAEIDDGGMVPTVTKVTIYGVDQASGKAIVETMKVSGGDIKE